MYYLSRFFVLGLFICSCMFMSDWTHKVEMKRDVASVSTPESGWDYQEKWDYHAKPTKDHTPHYSPSYKQ